MNRHWFYIRIVVGWAWNIFRGMLSTHKTPFFFSLFSLALLNQELKEEFITYTLAHYSSQQNKPIIPKLPCKLRKQSILEIFSLVLCDI